MQLPLVAKIACEREIRDCPANERYRKEGGRLIADYRVLIDGEHRATFRSEASCGRGYRLHDRDGRAIRSTTAYAWAAHLGDPCPRKSQMLSMAEDYLRRGLIPTHEQMASLKVREALEAREREAAEARERQLDQLRPHGLTMLHALKTIAGVAVGNSTVLAHVTYLARCAIRATEET